MDLLLAQATEVAETAKEAAGTLSSTQFGAVIVVVFLLVFLMGFVFWKMIDRVIKAADARELRMAADHKQVSEKLEENQKWTSECVVQLATDSTKAVENNTAALANLQDETRRTGEGLQSVCRHPGN